MQGFWDHEEEHVEAQESGQVPRGYVYGDVERRDVEQDEGEEHGGVEGMDVEQPWKWDEIRC